MSSSTLAVGIVGLPNVGKSTLFNALLKKQQALAANYPFATIEPNIGIVPVPDTRLFELAKVVAFSEHSENSAKSDNQIFRESDNSESPSRSEFSGKLPPIKPATVEFVDIAGLVKGASEGAGLGNKFLSHIREVKVIAHVVRAFEDPDVVREGSSDPKSDYQTITTELAIADLATFEKINLRKHESKIKNYEEIIERLKKELNTGNAVRNVLLSQDEQEAIRDLFLLTSKPEIVVLNVAESQLQSAEEIIEEYAGLLGISTNKFVVISAKVEAELAALSEEEQVEYLKDLGVEQSGLERLIRKAYEELGLISFLTAGTIEVRAWTTRKGANAVQAAGEIHTDFMKRFIKAEVISFADYVELGGRKVARENGKARLEGKDYIVQDGDVIEFKIGS